MAKQTFSVGQVLTAAQMTSLQQTAMLGGAASAKTASYTLVAADAGTAISMTSTSATTITVNTGLFAAGDTVQITNLGAGVCTITAGTATVNTSASLALAQYESGTLDFTSTSAAIFIKGAGAAAASGGMTLISTTTMSSTSVTLSSIPGTYTDLIFVMSGVTNSDGNGQLYISPNNNGSVTDSVGIIATSTYNVTDGAIEVYGNTNSLRTDANNAFVFRISNYASTTTFKPFLFSGSFVNGASAKRAVVVGGNFKSTSAVTSLVFALGGTTFNSGTILLYGVK